LNLIWLSFGRICLFVYMIE